MADIVHLSQNDPAGVDTPPRADDAAHSPGGRYQSIFWNCPGLHEMHFGWDIVERAAGIKVMTQRIGPFRRDFVLLKREGLHYLHRAHRQLLHVGAASEVYFHDFDRALRSSALRHRLNMRRIETKDRMLPTETFVIDLRRSEEEILANMNKDYRRRIRQSARQGHYAIHVHARPDARLVEQFAAAHAEIGRLRGFRGANLRPMFSMYEAGEGLLFELKNAGETTNLLHCYVAKKKALALYAVNFAKSNDGAGQTLHWEVMRALKGLGVEWYDFNGFPVRSERNGIYVFKARFGGQLIDLGEERIVRGGIFQLGKQATSLLTRRDMRPPANDG